MTKQPNPQPAEADDQQEGSKHAGGRPPKFETVEELDQAIRAYFDLCDPHIETRMVDAGVNQRGETIWQKREVMTEQQPYTVSGLARALGMTREMLVQYKRKEKFSDSILSAYERCHEYAEKQLYLLRNANGAVFVAIQQGAAVGGSQAPVVNSWVRTSKLSRPHLVAVDR